MSVRAGQIMTAAVVGAISDKADFLESRPMAVLQQTVVQSTANGVWTAITMDAEITDPYSGHSIVSNTSRYTCQYAGWYRISGRVAFATNSTGSRGARVHKNGTLVAGAATILAAGTLNGIPEVNHLIELAVGDYVEICGGQNSGGSLNTAFASESASMMYVIWEHA